MPAACTAWSHTSLERPASCGTPASRLPLLLSAAYLCWPDAKPQSAGQTAALPSAATAAAPAASAASAPDDIVLFRGGLNHTQVLVHYATNRVPDVSATGATGRYKGEVGPDPALWHRTGPASPGTTAWASSSRPRSAAGIPAQSGQA